MQALLKSSCLASCSPLVLLFTLHTRGNQHWKARSGSASVVAIDVSERPVYLFCMKTPRQMGCAGERRCGTAPAAARGARLRSCSSAEAREPLKATTLARATAPMRAHQCFERGHARHRHRAPCRAHPLAACTCALEGLCTHTAFTAAALTCCNPRPLLASALLCVVQATPNTGARQTPGSSQRLDAPQAPQQESACSLCVAPCAPTSFEHDVIDRNI